MMNENITRRKMLAGTAGLLALAQTHRAKASALDNFSLTAEKPPVPDIQFRNATGDVLNLSDYRGKVLLLNAWATWCGPCIHEMPGLDTAQAQLAGDDFQVLPISMDRGGVQTVDLFYRAQALRHLPILLEHRASIAVHMKPRGLPFTLLIDREGNEIGRALGEVYWNAPESLALLRQYISA